MSANDKAEATYGRFCMVEQSDGSFFAAYQHEWDGTFWEADVE